MKVADPIFKDNLQKISWEKIYSREYGVQYSEMAILCLTDKAKSLIPKPSINQIVVPEGNNSSFYIDASSWGQLTRSLDHKYASNPEELKKYEEQFVSDGETYVKTAKKLAEQNLKNLGNGQLGKLYLNYQQKLFRYSIFAWTSFILNNFIAENAVKILDKYIETGGLIAKKQEIYDSLFHPEKKAAVLALQEEMGTIEFTKLYEKYKWLSCLDLHNRPWTKEKFKSQLKSWPSQKIKKITPFGTLASQLAITHSDLDYLYAAKRFVYVKDARDDFRRQGVFYALEFFKEVARRMKIRPGDISYLQEKEILEFLQKGEKVAPEIIRERKVGFTLYLDGDLNLICLTGEAAKKVISSFNLQLKKENKQIKITGRVASQGKATGKVSVVLGVKDVANVKIGDVLVAVTTHPDYVPAMKKCVAIVTDEGGITSHAAIISREFGLPCIVGTKVATTLLENGDEVEVNAIEGWVKKL